MRAGSLRRSLSAFAAATDAPNSGRHRNLEHRKPAVRAMAKRGAGAASSDRAIRIRRVADPVIGIMIRTRIGMEVYGTNTELENLKLGPCAAGESAPSPSSFECDLCPQFYTITAASHDPDGVWHDWMEDAVGIRSPIRAIPRGWRICGRALLALEDERRREAGHGRKPVCPTGDTRWSNRSLFRGTNADEHPRSSPAFQSSRSGVSGTR